MRENFTRIAVILDRSGSMESCKESTVTGFNSFVAEQKKLPGEAKLKLVQFDNEYETVFDKPLSQAPELTQTTFVPRGSTALLDAQGRTIIDLGNELEKMPEHERPSKIIVVTLTDGAENASHEFTAAKISEMIKHQRETYGWDFVFLGANQDAIKTAASMNIPMASSMTYAANARGMSNTMAAVSNYVGLSRSGLVANFTDDERVMAMVSDDDDKSSLGNLVSSSIGNGKLQK